jgi:hypothetical protein
MPGLRVSNEVIYARTEVTYNVDPTPTTSDAILTRGRPTFASEGLRQNERSAVRGSLGTLQSVFGGTLKKISFECEVKGSGTAGTAPEIGPLIEACGMEEVIVVSTSVTYRPESASHESVTIYWFEGGRKRHIMTGCRGTVTFRLEAGGILVAAFEFTGHYTEPTDQSIPSPTYDSTVPRAGLGMTVSVNGVSTLVAKSWEWSLNNTIALPPSLGSSDGYGEILITRRDVRGQIDIEAELDSLFDADVLLSAGTRFAFASGLLGSVAGNRVQITTPSSSTYITDTTPGEADGLALRTLQLAVDDSTADQELSVAFT